MADTRGGLMESIREKLAGFPEESVRAALVYYEEYIAEALEAGRTEEEILDRLGGMDEIVRNAAAEETFARAESRPGPIRLAQARKQVSRGLADSAARFSFIVGASFPYVLAMCLYVIAAAAMFGAVAGAALMAYGITTMTAAHLREMVGVAGAALFSGAFLVCVGLGIWRAANGVSRVALRVLRRGLRRGLPASRRSQSELARTGKLRTAFLVCGICGLLGIGACFISGIPMKLYSIWDSATPEVLTARAWTYAPGEVREIEAATLSSSIVIQTAPARTDSIRISYEEPEWLAGASIVSDGRLVFREASAGMFPFMTFLARHPGMMTVTITVPQGYSSQAVTATSMSGNILLSLPARRIKAETGTGAISFTARGRSRVVASAPRGKVFVQDEPLGIVAYEAGPAGADTVELKSTEGRIEIH